MLAAGQGAKPIPAATTGMSLVHVLKSQMKKDAQGARTPLDVEEGEPLQEPFYGLYIMTANS